MLVTLAATISSTTVITMITLDAAATIGVSRYRNWGQIATGRVLMSAVDRNSAMMKSLTEVGLQLYDGVTASAGEAVDCPDKQALQTFSEVGPPKELDGVAVLVRPFAEVDLPEVGRELRLLVAFARDVLVGCDDLPPRLETGRGSALNGDARLPAPLPARLLVEAHPLPLSKIGMFGAKNDISRTRIVLGEAQHVIKAGGIQHDRRMSRKQHLSFVYRGQGIINGRHRLRMDPVLRLLDQVYPQKIDQVGRQGKRREPKRAVGNQPGGSFSPPAYS